MRNETIRKEYNFISPLDRLRDVSLSDSEHSPLVSSSAGYVKIRYSFSNFINFKRVCFKQGILISQSKFKLVNILYRGRRILGHTN